MKRLLAPVVLLIVWSGFLLAALSIHDSSAFSQHSICGVWGCGPPVNALLAVHSGWIMAIWLPLFYFQWRIPMQEVITVRIAKAMLAIGSAGVVGIILWQCFVWLPQASGSAADFLVQRCMFAVITTVDWPFLQIMSGGLILMAFEGYRRPRYERVEIPPSVQSEKQ